MLMFLPVFIHPKPSEQESTLAFPFIKSTSTVNFTSNPNGPFPRREQSEGRNRHSSFSRRRHLKQRLPRRTIGAIRKGGWWIATNP